MSDNTKTSVDTLEKPVELFTEDNKCKDFDEDCAELEPCAFKCWLYDPSQGWCPFLKDKGIEI